MAEVFVTERGRDRLEGLGVGHGASLAGEPDIVTA